MSETFFVYGISFTVSHGSVFTYTIGVLEGIVNGVVGAGSGEVLVALGGVSVEGSTNIRDTALGERLLGLTVPVVLAIFVLLLLGPFVLVVRLVGDPVAGLATVVVEVHTIVQHGSTIVSVLLSHLLVLVVFTTVPGILVIIAVAIAITIITIVVRASSLLVLGSVLVVVSLLVTILVALGIVVGLLGVVVLVLFVAHVFFVHLFSHLDILLPAGVEPRFVVVEVLVGLHERNEFSLLSLWYKESN